MVPPPTNGHRPATLIEAARKSQTHLETLRLHAQKSKAEIHTSATKSLLDEVIRHTNGSIGSLKTWTTEIEKGRQTSAEKIINTVNAYFEQLEESITAAEAALEIRRHLRWPRFLGRHLIKKLVRGSKHCHDPLADLMQEMQISGSSKLWLMSAPQSRSYRTKSRQSCGTLRTRKSVTLRLMKSYTEGQNHTECSRMH